MITIRYSSVHPVTAGTRDSRLFADVYRQVFGGAPYYETYSDEDVSKDVWEPHLQDGLIIQAHGPNGQLIGFGCALPLDKAPDDVREFLREHNIEGALPTDFSKTWYMSEVGVLEGYRRQGIGTHLIMHRMIDFSHAEGTHYVFRTAAEGSMSMGLYLKFGATDMGVVQDVSGTDQVQVAGSQSHTRKYLYGDTRTAMANIARLHRSFKA